MNDWQTIDTAPKDGTPILCFGEMTMFTAYWFRWPDGFGEWALCATGTNADGPECNPELWVTLPPLWYKGTYYPLPGTGTGTGQRSDT